ncbi:hypothetical protein CEB94_00245 [Streptomyces hawaiiensis]|uniref:Uncharacterized protein n=1 Tax=Streptomyces hawaiiensis TaxID=67305 RepID=A0A6G5R6F1_9ACTN|nr:hypothetical protein CEB94_00245 [Streptomyces hawaiiensis]
MWRRPGRQLHHPSEIPARIHTNVAVAWQRLSTDDWATYAAEVSRGSRPAHGRARILLTGPGRWFRTGADSPVGSERSARPADSRGGHHSASDASAVGRQLPPRPGFRIRCGSG